MAESGATGRRRFYEAPARYFHWATAVVVAVMVPVGLAMVYRGGKLDIWDDLTNNLYSAHKLTGFLLLWLIAARLAYRLWRGAPPDEPSLRPHERVAAHLVHWSLYGLLLAVPLTGWLGVSLFPALDIFGLFSLPALRAPNEAAAGRVLALHGTLALTLAGLACLHVGAALFHFLVRKDGVMARMLPGLGRK